MGRPIVLGRASKRLRDGIRTGLCVLAATTAGGVGGAIIPVAHADASGQPCLWAGNAYRQGLTVYAGGYAFSCHMDAYGNPRWNSDGASRHHSTVPNPGAGADPAGRFSPGAWQPGTSYDDYCVGDQLIAGSGDIFVAVADDTGLFPYWRSAGPISRWDFDAGIQPPSGTWRSASLCRDGVLS